MFLSTRCSHVARPSCTRPRSHGRARPPHPKKKRVSAQSSSASALRGLCGVSQRRRLKKYARYPPRASRNHGAGAPESGDPRHLREGFFAPRHRAARLPVRRRAEIKRRERPGRAGGETSANCPAGRRSRLSLLTYYTLCAENHRWWWRAFLAPATTGLYVFGYAAYYYGAHLQEEAFDALQAGLFFGYMLLVSLGVALVAGAAGFLASLKFLAYIFAQIKFD